MCQLEIKASYITEYYHTFPNPPFSLMKPMRKRSRSLRSIIWLERSGFGRIIWPSVFPPSETNLLMIVIAHRTRREDSTTELFSTRNKTLFVNIRRERKQERILQGVKINDSEDIFQLTRGLEPKRIACVIIDLTDVPWPVLKEY